MATKKKSTKTKAPTKKKVGAVHHHHTKKKTRKSYSRRKVGAISSTGEIILGAVAGGIATRIIAQNIPAPTSGGSDYRPYIGLVLGAGAEYFGKKNLLIRSMGIGAIVESSRAIITDGMLKPLKVIGSNQLPYTVHNKMGKRKINRMMGLQNSLAGTNKARLIAGTSTPNALAGTPRIYGYDGF